MQHENDLSRHPDWRRICVLELDVDVEMENPIRTSLTSIIRKVY